MRVRSFSGSWFRFALGALIVAPFFNAAALGAKEPPSDTCSLLTAGQLEKILGQPFGVPERSTAPAAYPGQPSGTECDYKTQKGLARKVVFIA